MAGGPGLVGRVPGGRSAPAPVGPCRSTRRAYTRMGRGRHVDAAQAAPSRHPPGARPPPRQGMEKRSPPACAAPPGPYVPCVIATRRPRRNTALELQELPGVFGVPHPGPEFLAECNKYPRAGRGVPSPGRCGAAGRCRTPGAQPPRAGVGGGPSRPMEAAGRGRPGATAQDRPPTPIQAPGKDGLPPRYGRRRMNSEF